MSFFDQANNLYNKKEYEKAINAYKKAIELKENKTASLYNTAVCFIKLNNYTRAISLLKAAIREKEDSRYFFNLGYCYAMLKDAKKALIYFNTAWALNNEDSDCEKAIDLIIQTLSKDK
ncbi:tetratricopeptide repeat protein [Clostridium ganghwense]|uniref:Tetratricopeptide repeat protein n=1 Tax=Clostridium ganghwense TaxID=312089 RepID=A0ABT4CNK2_9CLOT|nr:tetratricopeptide repeat protein [Clostridium ganghwense]MCY6370635.1 tetratricopeptide repeat protein [Clostridium ganghwense]